MKNTEKIYGIIMVLTLIVMSLGSTYAYYAATINSQNNEITSGSKAYSISLSVLPKYTGHKLIPLKDELIDKAIENECIDKNGQGACYAYTIRVYDYDEETEFISLSLNIETNGVTNLSYMSLDEDNNKTVIKNEENEDPIIINRITSGEEMEIGDFNVKGKSEYTLTLLIWLTDIRVSQNNEDLGTFNGNITVYAGKGGQITGNISSAISGAYVG